LYTLADGFRELRELRQQLGDAERARKTPDISLESFAAKYLQIEASQGVFAPMLPATDLHRALVADFGELRHRRGRKLNYLAPRGSAKTTWTTFAYPLAAACQRWEPYIILTADTKPQAEDYLETIKRELESNDALAEAYPDAGGKGVVWRSDRIRLRNGVQIDAYGTGAKLRGRKSGVSRPSLIVIDDPQNKDHIVSELQRRRSLEWMMKDVLNAGNPQTNYVVAGTALHRECIVCTLEKTPGWDTRAFKNIIQMPYRMDLWGRWKEILLDWEDEHREAKALEFYLAHQREMNE
jgi:hypothetical protein